MARHPGVVDNYTFVKVFTDEQRPESWGADARDLCTVIDIRGDYAFVKYDATGIVSEVAIALLPFGVDVGDKLKFEDYEFTLV